MRALVVCLITLCGQLLSRIPGPAYLVADVQCRVGDDRWKVWAGSRVFAVQREYWVRCSNRMARF